MAGELTVRGKCSRCGRVFVRPDSVPVTVECDCWKICPLCGAEMAPYMPVVDTDTYAADGKRDLLILRVCCNAHLDNRPFFSVQRPVEVELS